MQDDEGPCICTKHDDEAFLLALGGIPGDSDSDSDSDRDIRGQHGRRWIDWMVGRRWWRGVWSGRLIDG